MCCRNGEESLTHPQWGRERDRGCVYDPSTPLSVLEKATGSSFSCAHTVYATLTKDTRPQWFYGQIVPNIAVLCQLLPETREFPLPSLCACSTVTVKSGET